MNSQDFESKIQKIQAMIDDVYRRVREYSGPNQVDLTVIRRATHYLEMQLHALRPSESRRQET